jgi:hypothetical protein
VAPSTIDRRGFLHGALALGVFSRSFSGRARGIQRRIDQCRCDLTAIPVIAACQHRGDVVGLLATTSGFSIAELHVDASGRVTAGAGVPLDLPLDVLPTSMGGGARGLVIGAVEVFPYATYRVDNSQASMSAEDVSQIEPRTDPDGWIERIDLGFRPAIFGWDGALERIELPTLSPRRFASPSALGVVDDGSMFVAVDESSDDEVAQAASSVLLSQTPDGRWTREIVRTGLAEGGPSHLAVGPRGIVVISQSSQGTGHVMERSPAAPAKEQGAPISGPPVLAAVADGDLIRLYQRSDGGDVTMAERAGRSAWVSRPVPPLDRGDPAIDIVQIGGFASRAIVLGASGARMDALSEATRS